MRHGIARLALVLGLLCAAQAFGQASMQTWDVNVSNTVGEANDIHLDFANTGGLVSNPQLISPNPNPNTQLQPEISVSASGSGIDASWPNTILSDGDQFEATFQLPSGFTPEFSTGYWTSNGTDIGAVNPFSVVVSSVAPEPGALAILGAIVVPLAMRRRERR